MHTAPTEGTPRDVAGPVIDMLFPPGTPYRIPIAAITGTNGKTTTTRMVGHILKLSGFTVGMTTSDGVYIDGELTVTGDMTGPWASHLVLRDPAVDAAVLETARGGIVRTGLGWRKCKVGAVLNVAADHLGMGGINDLDELAEVKQVVVEVAQEWCVLNADDERVARMAEHSHGQAHLRHHAARERAGAPAHPRQGPGRGAGGGLERADDRALRGRGADPAAVGAADPGHHRGARPAQRPERHVRHRHRSRHGDQPGEHPPGPAHLHHRLLPDPGPHEFLQRASLPGAARLRPQRSRHGSHGADDPRADRHRPAHRRPGRSG